MDVDIQVYKFSYLLCKNIEQSRERERERERCYSFADIYKGTRYKKHLCFLLKSILHKYSRNKRNFINSFAMLLFSERRVFYIYKIPFLSAIINLMVSTSNTLNINMKMFVNSYRMRSVKLNILIVDDLY